MWVSGSVPYGTFLLAITLAATWQITYAPYVADYSRYLPENTNMAATFWWTAVGSVIGSYWLMGFGAVGLAVAPKLFNGGSVTFFTGLGNNHTGWLIALIIIGGIVAANVLNLYGMFMSSTTTITALRRMQVHRGARTIFVLVAAVIGTVLAIAATSNFLDNFENFILFLAYFLIPWTAINLTDFYFVRKERYDIDSIFRPDGIYGRIDWRTMVAYLVAIGVEDPVHEHDLLHRSDGLAPRRRGHLLDPGPDRRDRSLLRLAHGCRRHASHRFGGSSARRTCRVDRSVTR